jgi:hypothetical protein
LRTLVRRKSTSSALRGEAEYRDSALLDHAWDRARAGGAIFSRHTPYLKSQYLDGLAIATLAIAAVIVLAVFRNYGLGWDDYTHAQYGELLVSFFASGFHDQRALSWVNLYMYGGGFDLVSALAAKVLPFTLFETRRLMGGMVGLVGLFMVWRAGRRIGGPLAGLIALLLLASCPLYVGHVFINAKDGPFAVAMAVLLLGLIRTFEEYPKPSVATGILTAVGLGLAIGARVLGAFGVLSALGTLALVVAIDMRADGAAIAARRLGRFTLAILPFVILAYAVMALEWPWGAASPLNPLRAVAYFSHFFEKPWDELYGGALVRVTDMPRSYVPTLMLLKLPAIFTALGIGGAAGALMASCRREFAPSRRAVLLLVLLAAFLPIVVTVATGPALYNGIRHFVFVLPPLAVLGGLAGAWLLERLRRYSRAALAGGAIVLTIGIASPIIAMVRIHPYEYTYFNRFIGGVSGARGRYMLDYWPLSFNQASQALHAWLTAHHET